MDRERERERERGGGLGQVKDLHSNDTRARASRSDVGLVVGTGTAVSVVCHRPLDRRMGVVSRDTATKDSASRLVFFGEELHRRR